MQSQSRLQEEAVDVVINFLVRQRGSYVTWPCLPTCSNTIPATDVNLIRCRHVRSCLLSAAATRHSLTPFPHSVWSCLDVHMTDLSHGWSGGGVREGEGGNIGCRYCLRGAGCTMVWTIQPLFYWKHDFVREIGVCGLCAHVGYMHEKTVVASAHLSMCFIVLKSLYGKIPIGPDSRLNYLYK